MEEELKYILMFARTKGIGPIRTRMLMETFGSAKNALYADSNTLAQLPRFGQLIAQLRHDTLAEKRAEQEIEFIHTHHIKPLIYGQAGYPKRLMECEDAPVLLQYLGEADLESKHILSIVGTRNCTQYGRDMVNSLVKDLKASVPDLLIISGLALGIDVTAHQAALTHQIPTVGVVAHGLDRIYPSAHRPIAKRMIAENGGIVTEYCSGTEPERGNFIARNRIIAGLADVVLVAESKDKGGSLVTASIANDYGRDVVAFPGRTTDDRSKGCNRLIRTNGASLITCAQDLLEALNWGNPEASNTVPTQYTLNFEEHPTSPLGTRILKLLEEQGDLRIFQLQIALPDIDRAIIIEELLDLELNGKIRTCPGGIYQKR